MADQNNLNAIDPLFSKPMGVSSGTTTQATPVNNEDNTNDLHTLDPIFAKPLGAASSNQPKASVEVLGWNPNNDISPFIPATAGAAIGYAANKLAPPINPSPTASPGQLANLESMLAGKRAAVNQLSGAYQTALDTHAGNVDQLRTAYQAANAQLNDAMTALNEAKSNAKALNLPMAEVAEDIRASNPNKSGTFNYAKKMPGQVLPDVLAAQAEDMTKGKNVRGMGAYDIQARDVQNLEKIKGIGGGNYELIGEGKGQLMLPPEATKLTEEQMLAQEALHKAELAHEKAMHEAAKAKIELEKLQSHHAQPKAVSSAERALERARMQAAEYEARLKALADLPNQSTFGKRALAFGRTIAKPLGGALALGELTHGMEELNRGNYLSGSMGLMGGAGGALMASPFPQAKVAGALMSVPPLVYQGYQAYKNYKGQ